MPVGHERGEQSKVYVSRRHGLACYGPVLPPTWITHYTLCYLTGEGLVEGGEGTFL